MLIIVRVMAFLVSRKAIILTINAYLELLR